MDGVASEQDEATDEYGGEDDDGLEKGVGDGEEDEAASSETFFQASIEDDPENDDCHTN